MEEKYAKTNTLNKCSVWPSLNRGGNAKSAAHVKLLYDVRQCSISNADAFVLYKCKPSFDGTPL